MGFVEEKERNTTVVSVWIEEVKRVVGVAAKVVGGGESPEEDEF